MRRGERVAKIAWYSAGTACSLRRQAGRNETRRYETTRWRSLGQTRSHQFAECGLADLSGGELLGETDEQFFVARVHPLHQTSKTRKHCGIFTR